MNRLTRALLVPVLVVTALLGITSTASAATADICSEPNCAWDQGHSTLQTKTSWYAQNYATAKYNVWGSEIRQTWYQMVWNADITTDFFHNGNAGPTCHFVDYSTDHATHTCTGYFGADHQGYVRYKVDVHNDGSGVHTVWVYYGLWAEYQN